MCSSRLGRWQDKRRFKQALLNTTILATLSLNAILECWRHARGGAQRPPIHNSLHSLSVIRSSCPQRPVVAYESAEMYVTIPSQNVSTLPHKYDLTRHPD